MPNPVKGPGEQLAPAKSTKSAPSGAVVNGEPGLPKRTPSPLAVEEVTYDKAKKG